MFKKTCFDCGAKVDIVYEGLCENCYKEQNPPIKEIKPINMKYCNKCKKIVYSNQYYTKDEIKEKINDIVKKNLIINDGYILNEIKVLNFKVEGSKVSFDVEIDSDLVE